MAIENLLVPFSLLFLCSNICLGYGESHGIEALANGQDELGTESLKSLLENYVAKDILRQWSITQSLQQSRELHMLQEKKIKALETELHQQNQMLKTIVSQFTTEGKHPPPRRETYSQHNGEEVEKRSDDNAAWEPVLSHVTQQLSQVTADIQALQNANAQRLQAAGSVYTRWGNASCPGSTETVYSGYIGGSSYASTGSAANSLCLPHKPVFDDHAVPRYGSANLYGAEYETCDETECDLTPACAVCRTPKLSVIMVPATDVCHPGWSLEYSGYLMAGHPTHASATEYICVDKSRGYIEGTQGSQNGRLLYYTAVHCNSLSCPPYVDGKIVLCAVCSK